MLKNCVVMVVGATRWQIPLIDKIRSLGLQVLAIGPDKGSPAFQIANFYEILDIRDLDGCLDVARKYRISAVLSDQSDIAVATVSYITEKLSLLGLNYQMALECTNKFLMRENCARIGVPSTKYEYCDTPQKLKSFFHKSRGKIIVKPLNSNSSRGVTMVDDEAMILTAFDNAVCYTHGDQAVLAETYIEGPEFTVDGIVINGTHFSLATSRKKHYRHNANIACELLFSYSHVYFDYQKLKNTNNLIYDSLNLPDGTLTHSEFKFSDGNFKLIEYAARGGGNLIASTIVPYVSGFDNYGYYINSRTRNRIFKDYSAFEQPHTRCAVLKFFDIDGEGELSDITGIDFLDSTPEIMEYSINFSIGNYIKNPANDALRIGFYIALAENEKRLNYVMSAADKEVTFSINPGKV